jgi:hypothetical protein
MLTTRPLGWPHIQQIPGSISEIATNIKYKNVLTKSVNIMATNYQKTGVQPTPRRGVYEAALGNG